MTGSVSTLASGIPTGIFGSPRLATDGTTLYVANFTSSSGTAMDIQAMSVSGGARNPVYSTPNFITALSARGGVLYWAEFTVTVVNPNVFVYGLVH